MSNRNFAISTLLATLGLGACTSTSTPKLDPDFGAAISHNVAVQVINPDAGPPDASETIDGQKAQQAIEAYYGESEAISTDSLIQNVGGD